MGTKWIRFFTVVSLLLSTNLSVSQPYNDVNIPYASAWISFHPESGDIILFDQSNRENRTLTIISKESDVDTVNVDLFPHDSFFLFESMAKSNVLRFWDYGVGRVYDFDLASQEFRRIDTSHNHRNQFGHAAYMDSTGRIYAMGGYGYWRLKKLLIYFNPESGQWNEIPAKGLDNVPAIVGGHMFKDGGQIYYIANENSGDSSQSSVYEFNIETETWKKSREINYLLKNIGQHNFNTAGGKFFRKQLTYSVDKKRNLVALASYKNHKNLVQLLDYKENKLFTIDPTEFGIYNFKAIFYSPNDDHWVFVGHPPNPNQKDRLVVKAVNLSESLQQFDSKDVPYWVAHPVRVAVMSLFILAIMVSAGYYYYQRRSLVSSSGYPSGKPVKPLKIVHRDGSVKEVYIQGERQDLQTEPLLEKLWNAVILIKQTGEGMLYEDFDRYVFGPSISSPNRSRMRKKAFETVNSNFEEPLIIAERSEVDKRIMIIKIADGDLIDLEEK